MQRKLVWFALCLAAAGVMVLHHAQLAHATASPGFTAVNVVKGTFADFQVINHLTQVELQQLAPTFPGVTWTAMEKTQGPSDLYVQSNTWAVGGSTGWHRHPGHSLIIITSGRVTQYHSDCSPQVYGPGTPNGPTLVDTGDDEHLIRNEGAIPATGFAVQIVANGAPRKIDEPSAPATCQIF